MTAFRPVEEQLAVIRRGVERIEPLPELVKKLERSVATGKPLRIKLGIDPTGFDVHLGHTVVLRKLRQFQELGHQVVLIIGTATAQVGDPSGRDDARKGLTPEQIQKNAETYLTQIAKVIDTTNAEVVRNGDWFDRFDFGKMLHLLSQITIQRMMERDDFTKRIKSGTPIYLHECLYPLMQGHDSVEIHADVELGGTEQLFNLMLGRDLQRAAQTEPQIALTMPILRGLDGEKKMGKSLNNYIGLNESPREQFGKTMSIPDTLLKEWFELLTDRPEAEIAALLAGHPMEAKKTLGVDVVTCYHGAEVALQARKDWETQFSAGKDPEQMDELPINPAEFEGGIFPAGKLLVATKWCKSGKEAKQKIAEGAFNYGPEKLKPADPQTPVPVTEGLVVRLGRKIGRIKLT